MIELEPGERAYMTEMRMLTTDADRREVLCGLTEEESDFYVLYSRRGLTDGRPTNPEDGARYLALHARHERVRFQVLGAELELRVDAPTRN